VWLPGFLQANRVIELQKFADRMTVSGYEGEMEEWMDGVNWLSSQKTDYDGLVKLLVDIAVE